jgi:hypothetical protein
MLASTSEEAAGVAASFRNFYSKPEQVIYRNAIVVAGPTPNSYVILKGTKIEKDTKKNCPPHIAAARSELFSAGEYVELDGYVKKDYLVEGSKSYLAGLISGNSANGKQIFAKLN